MNKEIQTIIRNFENTLDGEPWYGRPVYAMLREVESSIAYKKPTADSHSLIELLYHMLTWAEFTLKRIEKEDINDLDAFEKLDWRNIDPKIHSWKKGLKEFKKVQQQIIRALQTKDDDFLEEKVDYRTYNFRFLLEGMIQHTIYHLGQIAYLQKMLA